MKLSKPLISRVLRVLGMVVAGLVAFILILSIFRVSIPLGFLQPKIETAASQLLGRDFKLEKAPRVVIGLKPTFKIEGCTIGNPAGWPAEAEPLAQLERFFIKLGLVPLLKKNIRIDDLEITGLHLILEQQADGGKNWVFKPETSVGETKPEGTAATPKSGGGWDFLELRRLSIEDVGLKSFGPEGEKNLKLAVDSVKGRAASGEGLALDLKGTFQEKPFQGTFRGESLAELLDDEEAWPYEFSGDLAGASVTLNGAFGTVDLEEAGAHNFTIDAPDMEKLEHFTGPLPRFGSVHLDGKLRFTQSGVAMPVLNGNLGETTLHGDLDIVTTGETPRVIGHLDLGSINVAIFKKQKNAVAAEEKKAAPAAIDEDGSGGEGEPGPLQRMKKKGVLPFVGEVRLTIAEVLNSKVKVRGLDMGVQVEEDVVTADVSVEFAEAPLRGDLEVRKHDREENPISMALDMEAKDADIGELVRFYTNASGFKGEFERLKYNIDGAGADLPDAWSRKQVGLEVVNADMTYQGKENAFKFHLNRGFIDGAWNREARMGADGLFLGEVFSVKFNKLKAEKADLLGKPPFVELSGEAFGAKFTMAGETRRKDIDPKLPLNLEVSGESLGALHNWVGGVPEAAALPYGMKGTILFENGWHLGIAEGTLGQTRLSGEIGVKKSEEDSAFLAKLAVGTLDFRELKVLFGKGAEGEKAVEKTEDAGGGFTLDTKLLPAGVHVDDAELDLKVEKLVFEDSEVLEVALAAEVRDGWVEQAPFAFTHNGKKFEGIGAFDFRNDQPEAGLELNVESVDIGNILQSIQVAKGIDAQAGKLGLRVHARGETLREILVESDLDITFSDAQWIVQDFNTGAAMPIAIETGSLGGNRGEPTVLMIDGKLKETPLKLAIKTDGIDALIKKGEQINMTLDAEIAGSKIQATGRTLLPLDRTDLNADLTWTGEKLSDLDALLGVDLPPLGPVSLKGNIQVVEEGYSLSGLDLVVGETDLKGNLSVNTTGKRPLLKADLNTGRFQINDFAVKGWSPKTGTATANLTERVAAADRKFAELASPEVLGSFDANISLKAGDVRSGKDTLGSGSLQARLNEGRLEISPVTVAIPGGDFSAKFHYFPRAKTYDWELTLKTDRFDYGVLARRKDPATDVGGFLNVDVALKNTNAPVDDFVMAHSTGHLNFEVCPELMRGNIFDFWGANLLFALLPRIDPESGSKVNCIIGRMNIENGLMTPEALGIDTTRVRVISEGKIDFKEDKIDLLLVPRPKRPEFLRAGTKLMVQGTFEDFKIETGPMPILRSLARMTGSTLLFPGNLLFQERIPEDGSDVCSCKKE